MGLEYEERKMSERLIGVWRGYKLKYYEEGGHNLWSLWLETPKGENIWQVSDFDTINELFEDGFIDPRKGEDSVRYVLSMFIPKHKIALAARKEMKNPPRIPKDYEVQPLKPGQPAKARATCGTCGLSWDDAISTSMTPVPGGRCPFEYFHKYKNPKGKMVTYDVVGVKGLKVILPSDYSDYQIMEAMIKHGLLEPAAREALRREKIYIIKDRPYISVFSYANGPMEPPILELVEESIGNPLKQGEAFAIMRTAKEMARQARISRQKGEKLSAEYFRGHSDASGTISYLYGPNSLKQRRLVTANKVSIYAANPPKAPGEWRLEFRSGCSHETKEGLDYLRAKGNRCKVDFNPKINQYEVYCWWPIKPTGIQRTARRLSWALGEAERKIKNPFEIMKHHRDGALEVEKTDAEWVAVHPEKRGERIRVGAQYDWERTMPGIYLYNPKNKTEYEVLVGNIGTVLRTNNLTHAESVFQEYVKMSLGGYGRAAGESVTILRKGEPYKEYQGTVDNPLTKEEAGQCPKCKVPLTIGKYAGGLRFKYCPSCGERTGLKNPLDTKERKWITSEIAKHRRLMVSAEDAYNELQDLDSAESMGYQTGSARAHTQDLRRFTRKRKGGKMNPPPAIEVPEEATTGTGRVFRKVMGEQGQTLIGAKAVRIVTEGGDIETGEKGVNLGKVMGLANGSVLVYAFYPGEVPKGRVLEVWYLDPDKAARCEPGGDAERPWKHDYKDMGATLRKVKEGLLITGSKRLWEIRKIEVK